MAQDRLDRPRRRDHRIGRGWRDRHEGAGRPRRPRAPHGSRPDGHHERLQDAGQPARRLASRRRRRGDALHDRSRGAAAEHRASSVRPMRPTSRTPSRPAASSAGRDRACIGGRTNHYGRVQLRYSDYDFKNKSMKGVGFDWPIGYEDLAPYYDKAERFIGVTGRAGRTAQRARRHLPDAGAVQAARTSHLSRLREARHQGDQLAPGGDHRAR